MANIDWYKIEQSIILALRLNWIKDQNCHLQLNIYVIAILLFDIIYFKYWIKYNMFKDPVCNMMVDEKKAMHISEVGGKKVYLCSTACMDEFDRNPGKYV